MTAPAFLVDECLPFEVTLALRRRGFDASDIVERGARGASDDDVWEIATSERRILATRDLDFPLRDRAKKPPGLVLLRARDDATASELGALVEALLDALPATSLEGHITVVAPGRYRRRAW